MFHKDISVNILLKHIVIILLIYLLLRVIPKTPMETKENIIATIAIYVVFLVVYSYKNNEHMDGNINQQPAMPPAMPPPSMPPQQPPAMPPAMPPQQPTPTIPSVEECSSCKVDLSDNTDVKKTSNDENMTAYTYQPKYRYVNAGSRAASGVIANEMSYTDYNTLPVGSNVNSQNSDFSYSFLPPDRWYPIPPHPPVCVTETKCPVCPLTSNSESINLKEWDDSRRITPGDVVNTNYVAEKLNSGR